MMKEIKLFVSCPMKDKLPAEILATRYRCLAEVQKRTTDKVVLIDSYFEHKEHSPKLQSLGESIILMGGADLVCFAEGWKEARGCRIEHDVASEYKIPIMDEDDKERINFDNEEERKKHQEELKTELERLKSSGMNYIVRCFGGVLIACSEKPVMKLHFGKKWMMVKIDSGFEAVKWEDALLV